MRKLFAFLSSTLVLVALVALMAPQGATAASSGTPRWVLHVRNFPGGISNGVRAQATSEVARAQAQYRASSLTAGPQTRGGALMNVQMNDDSNPPMPQNEESVAYDVYNPMIAVAASNDYVSGGVAIMRTNDGGRSWKTTRLTPQFDGTGDFCSGGDPAVAYSRRDKAFYLTQLCFFRALPFSEAHLYTSLDNGATWTPGRQRALVASNFDYSNGTVDTSVFYDKEYLAVDNTPTSPHYGRIYVTYTKFHLKPSGFSDYCPIQLAYTDSVPSFNPSLAVWNHTAVVPDHPGGKGLGQSADQFSQPVVENDGTLDVSYVTEECNTAIDHHLFLRKSLDGGAGFSGRIQIDRPGEFKDNPNPADLLPNKNFRAGISPSIAYNPVDGALAYAYQNNINRAHSGADISVNRSTDGGYHWSHAGFVSINNKTGKPAKNDQYFSWIAFDPKGTLWAIWLDNRLDPGNKWINTFQARSTDDGHTWHNYRISTRSWNPDLGFFTSGAFIGDYSGMAASNNVLYPVWTDGRNTAIHRTGIGETDVFTNVEIRP